MPASDDEHEIPQETKPKHEFLDYDHDETHTQETVNHDCNYHYERFVYNHNWPKDLILKLKEEDYQYEIDNEAKSALNLFNNLKNYCQKYDLHIFEKLEYHDMFELLELD